MNEEFMKKFKQKEKIVYFKTHKELDLFTMELLSIEVDFKNKYKDHWNFLKSLDRGIFLIIIKHFG
jgi:hypothetical protein